MLLNKQKYSTEGFTPEEMLGAGLVAGGLGGMFVGSQLQRAKDYARRKTDPIEYDEMQVIAPYSKKFNEANFYYETDNVAADINTTAMLGDIDGLTFQEKRLARDLKRRRITQQQYNDYAPLVQANRQALIKARENPGMYNQFSSGRFQRANFSQQIPTSTSQPTDTNKPKETTKIENPFGQKDMFSEITNAITAGDAGKLRAQKSYIEKQKKDGKITCDDYDFYMQKINENISNLEKSTRSPEQKGKQHFVSSDKVYYS